MKKAAPKTGTTNTARVEHSSTTSHGATKLELVALHLLENGPDGTSSLSGLARLHDLNFRNGVSDLRMMGVRILDERFKHQHTGGDAVSMKRYFPADRNQARKLAERINACRRKRGAEPLSQTQIASYLAAFPAPVSTS